ncbi:hypothetical protein [Undibacterium sp.]|uniref:hypothetical protein n=1 Tax=Undibacterium sp. TaxID=1914977 RepID=UPI003752081E
MINKENSPVEWAGLMYELEDASEHLSVLISEIENDPEFDETDFNIQLQHIFSHLSRAWHRRKFDREISELEWVVASKFPIELNQS